MSQRALTISSSQSSTPSGSGMDYWGSFLPKGWIWADGSYYEPSQYPKLFAAIGYIHGSQGTKFKVPDKRSRVSIGAGQGAGLSNRTLGQVLGEEEVTLSLAQSPSHGHPVVDPGHGHGVADPGHVHGVADPGHGHGVADPGHGHSIHDPGHKHGVVDPGHNHSLYAIASQPSAGTSSNDFLSTSNVAISGENSAQNAYIASNREGTALMTNAATNIDVAFNGTNIGIYAASANIGIYGSGTNISIASQGGGQGHNNIQPSIVCNYIIKL